MNRSTRTLVVLTIAVMMGGLASFGIYRVISSRPVAAQVETVSTVVAAQPLKLGDRLTKGHVKLVAWPASAPVAGSFSTIEEVLSRGVLTTVNENEPLTTSKLAPIEAGAGLTPSIPDGMRAVSVRVNEVIGVAGFTVPGTRVDVMVTVSNRQNIETITRVVLSNVQVLTAGTRYDQEKAKDGEPIPTSVVTLLLTPEDAERLTLAAAEGNIMLSLRNPLDTAPTVTSGARLAGLMGQQTAPAPSAQPPVSRRPRPQSVAPPVVAAPPPQRAPTVEAIRGGKRTEEVIR